MQGLNERGTEEKKHTKKKADGIVQSLSSKVWLLLRLNVLFLTFCVPVLTIPASVSGMTKALMNLVTKDDCELWNDFWREFRSGFWKSLAAGLAAAAVMAAVFFAGYAAYALSAGFISSLGVAFIIIFEALLFFALCYLFPILATVDIGLKHALKNSLLLAFIEIKHNALLLIPLALLAACVLLYPVSLPLLIFIIFSLCQFIVCTVVSGVIQKRITDPFYAAGAGKQAN